MTSQIILKYVASFFSYAADILINIWFFSRIDNKDRRSTVAGYLPLFLLFFLFFTPERLLPIADSRSLYNYGFQAGRLLYRWGIENTSPAAARFVEFFRKYLAQEDQQ